MVFLEYHTKQGFGWRMGGMTYYRKFGRNTFFKSSPLSACADVCEYSIKMEVLSRSITRFVEIRRTFCQKKEITSQKCHLLFKKYLKMKIIRSHHTTIYLLQEELQKCLHYHVDESRTVVPLE